VLEGEFCGSRSARIAMHPVPIAAALRHSQGQLVRARRN